MGPAELEDVVEVVEVVEDVEVGDVLVGFKEIGFVKGKKSCFQCVDLK